MVEKVYNPTVVPLYIGIFSTDPNQARNNIKQYSHYALDKLREQFTEDDQNITDEMDNLAKKGLNYPQSVHITSLFIGKNKNAANDICYKTFQENLSIPIEVTCVVYVPVKGQIICGTCFPDDKKIKVSNKIPHLTMMVGGWAPVMSNTILEVLMLDDQYLGKQYQDGIIADPKAEGLWKFENVEVPNTGKFTVYVAKVGKSLVIDGITKAHSQGGGGGNRGGKRGGRN